MCVDEVRNLAVVLRGAQTIAAGGRLEEAVAELRRALKINAHHAKARDNLRIALEKIASRGPKINSHRLRTKRDGR
jgi:hypothetical protein